MKFTCYIHTYIHILPFCLGIHNLISSFKSEFGAFYLDDETLRGTVNSIKEDLTYLAHQSSQLGLASNQSKSKVICHNRDSLNELTSDFSCLRYTDPSNAVLLGSPIGDIQSIDTILQLKIENQKLMGEHLPLKLLEAHDALYLLRHTFSLPKLLYVLRSAPCFLSSLLGSFDSTLCTMLESICNVKLGDTSWLQASLPINSGGLGIRSAVMLAPTAFLASTAGSTLISQAILPSRMHQPFTPMCSHALSLWSKYSNSSDPPSGLSASSQRTWDEPVIKSCFTSLVNSSQEPREKARFLACTQPHLFHHLICGCLTNPSE